MFYGEIRSYRERIWHVYDLLRPYTESVTVDLGLICSLKKEHVEYFEQCFQDQYEIVNGLHNVKLKYVAKLFAHLLINDSISLGICIHF
jgi:hypothetical protein